MHFLVRTTLAFLLVSLSAVANTDKPFEITPLVGYRFGGDFENIEEDVKTTLSLTDDVNYGLLLAWPYDNKRQSELLFSHYQSDFSKTGGFDQNDFKPGIGVSYLHIGGNVPISDDAVPLWLTGGLGLTHLSPESNELDSETRFSLNIGINTKYPITEHLSLRLGGRIYGTFFSSDSKIFCDAENCSIYVSGSVWMQSEVNAGLTFSF